MITTWPLLAQEPNGELTSQLGQPTAFKDFRAIRNVFGCSTVSQKKLWAIFIAFQVRSLLSGRFQIVAGQVTIQLLFSSCGFTCAHTRCSLRICVVRCRSTCSCSRVRSVRSCCSCRTRPSTGSRSRSVCSSSCCTLSVAWAAGPACRSYTGSVTTSPSPSLLWSRRQSARLYWRSHATTPWCTCVSMRCYFVCVDNSSCVNRIRIWIAKQTTSRFKY